MEILKRVRKVLLWLAAIFILGTAIIIKIAVQVKKDTPRNMCRYNMESIWKGCCIYASQHNAQFPSSLSDIAKTNAPFPLNYPHTYSCLSHQYQAGEITNVTAWTDYVLVSDLTTASPRKSVLLYERISDHYAGNIGGHILFVDGSVRWFDAQRAKEYETLIKGLPQPTNSPYSSPAAGSKR